MRKRTDFIIIHCSATPPGMDIGADEIRRWHVEDNGWSDIGYNDVIRRDGQCEEGRDLDRSIPAANEIGAHTKGFNSRSLGICLIGGVGEDRRPENNFTQAQFNTLKRLLRFYKSIFPDAQILGHCDLDSSKACPSFDVQEWLEVNGI